jgi:hypothetical protein
MVREGTVVAERKRTLGAYYSPEPYARLLVRWALAGKAGAVLDPSYGGCAVLRVALDELALLGAERPTTMIYGADIDGDTAPWAAHLMSRGVPDHHLRSADFLTLEPDVELPCVAAVVGNPPYVRHHWLTPEMAKRAAAAAARAGVHLSGRASLWAYFVVHAARFVETGGRMALLLPGAVLQADYATAVIRHLESAFGDVLLVRLRQRIFADAEEETIVVLASNAGSASAGCRVTEADGIQALQHLLTSTPVLSAVGRPAIDGVADWKLGAVDRRCLDLLQQILVDRRVSRLGDVAHVGIGTVTGANGFFVCTEREAAAMGVTAWTRLVVTRSAWLTGPELTARQLQQNARGAATRLMVLPSDLRIDRRTRLGQRIVHGEAAGVMNRHHCRRDPWWSLPSAPAPDAFLGYMGGAHRGLVMNRAAAASTNTIHQLRWKRQVAVSEARTMAVTSWSSLTRLCAELFGRHYGGGVLKLEIAAARRLPILAGEILAQPDWLICRTGGDQARNYADRMLLRSLDLTAGDLLLFRRSADALAAHRTAVPVAPPELEKRVLEA